jgi:hypothetical protein
VQSRQKRASDLFLSSELVVKLFLVVDPLFREEPCPPRFNLYSLLQKQAYNLQFLYQKAAIAHHAISSTPPDQIG